MAYQKGTETNVPASQAAKSMKLRQDLYFMSCLKIFLIHQFYLSRLSEFSCS